jgi:hypothetical protein
VPVFMLLPLDSGAVAYCNECIACAAGCPNSTLSCTNPVTSRYSPEAAPGYVTAPGRGTMTVLRYSVSVATSIVAHH